MKTLFTKKRDSMLQLFKAITLILGISFFPLTAHAQVFGKVFTSPEERDYLDYLRDDFVARSQLATFDIDEDVIPDIPDAVVTEEAAPEIITYKFGGIMTRINGNKMVWLNGKQIAENNLPPNFFLVNSNMGPLLNINSEGRRFQLKPGQSINMQSGLVTDSYQSSNQPVAAPPAATENLQNNTAEDSQETVVAAEEVPADPRSILDQLNAENTGTGDPIQQVMESTGQ